MSEEELPTGLSLTPLDESFRRDPYPILKRLRDAEPMHRDNMLQRWFVTDHDLVREIVRDKACLVDPRSVGLTPPPKPDWMEELVAEPDREPSILGLDDPDHKRLRGLVSKAFTPRSVENFRGRIEEIVDMVLAPLLSKPQFDLVSEFAGPIPTIVIAEMLGVDSADQEQFKTWSDLLVSSFNPILPEEERKEVVRTGELLRDYFRQAIKERRENPRDDLISDMIRAEEEGDKLSETEIITMCDLLIIAGNVTTTDLIGNGMLALLQHPEQLEKLRAQPELIENAVEEMLRYDTPVVNTGRLANADTQIGEVSVKRGDNINPSLAAANRDPSVYPDPDKFDIEREDTHHHSFGGGIHHCLGAPLARLEAQIAISKLLAAFPDLTLAEDEVVRKQIPVFQGCERLLIDTSNG